ncbi:formate dehydrogenase accessory sulfurtransferase FdhD [Bacillus sp. T3]|uniref:formate dehydrogenase accessory sulfurtransferase FdhD n=1 Tax=Bacillus sp. T3 TaxID=467262 RepID=UPI0029817D27|nr:formate dehydrogenase accessory sulfurtransferase FdhD [Bacillus sp. T3]
MNRKGCPEEYPISLVVNGYEIAVFQLTSFDLVDWTYGYLYSEGLIDSIDDVSGVTVNEDMGSIHVTLRDGFNEELFFQKRSIIQLVVAEALRFFR